MNEWEDLGAGSAVLTVGEFDVLVSRGRSGAWMASIIQAGPPGVELMCRRLDDGVSARGLRREALRVAASWFREQMEHMEEAMREEVVSGEPGFACKDPDGNQVVRDTL